MNQAMPEFPVTPTKRLCAVALYAVSIGVAWLMNSARERPRLWRHFRGSALDACSQFPGIRRTDADFGLKNHVLVLESVWQATQTHESCIRERYEPQ
jgi:hypothetical protein